MGGPRHSPNAPLDKLLQRVHPLGAGIAAIDVEHLQGCLVLLAPPESVHEDVVQIAKGGRGLIKVQVFQQQRRQLWERRGRCRIHPYGTGYLSLGCSVIEPAGHIRGFRGARDLGDRISRTRWVVSW